MLARLALAAAAVVWLTMPAPSHAQVNCQDLYGRMTWSYQHHDPRYQERAARYARNCQHKPQMGQMCRELRAACMHKNELGEQGAGNCRQYRERCR